MANYYLAFPVINKLGFEPSLTLDDLRAANATARRAQRLRDGLADEPDEDLFTTGPEGQAIFKFTRDHPQYAPPQQEPSDGTQQDPEPLSDGTRDHNQHDANHSAASDGRGRAESPDDRPRKRRRTAPRATVLLSSSDDEEASDFPTELLSPARLGVPQALMRPLSATPSPEPGTPVRSQPPRTPTRQR